MLPERIAHYRILEKLGEGGMGVVYRAEDEKQQRQVAIKLLCVDRAHDVSAVERFHREARIASSLSHPHICSRMSTPRARAIGPRASSLESDVPTRYSMTR